MSESENISEARMESIDKRLHRAQSDIIDRTRCMSVNQRYFESWSKLTEPVRASVRKVATAYQPISDVTQPSSLERNPLALERGLIIGANIGLLAVRSRDVSEFYNRIVGTLNSLAECREPDLIPDTMSFTGRDILDSVEPALLTYTEAAEGSVDEYLDDLYAIGIGYTATIGRCLLIEEELCLAQTKDPFAEFDIEAAAEALSGPEELRPKDLL